MSLRTAIEKLYIQQREIGHCHVLCDPQAGEAFAEWLASLDEEDASRIFLRDPLFADAPKRAPVLLRLPLSRLPLVEELMLRAQEEATDPHNLLRSVCAFIQSALPDETLAARLTQALDVKVDGQGIYFRYFDPRVFHHMAHLMPDDAFGHLFRGIATWSYFLWDGNLAVQQIPQSHAASGFLRLTSQEWHPFDTIEHFNATQRLFARQGLRFEPARTVEFFSQVHAARSLGLPAPDDTAYYLACSGHSVTPLAQHPAWPDVVALTRQDVPLAEALAHLCGVSLPAAPPPHILQSEPSP